MTYPVLKHDRWVTQSLKNNVISKRLGGNDLLTFRRVSRSAFHIAINVEAVVFEAPLVDYQVRSHDGCLDVFDITIIWVSPQFHKQKLGKQVHTEYATTSLPWVFRS